MVINNQEEIKVTKINKRFHARLIINGAIHDEMACSLKRGIGHICREMLRWYDKAGGSRWSSSSRKIEGTIPLLVKSGIGKTYDNSQKND